MMNAAILGVSTSLCLIFGIVPYLIIQGVIMIMAGSSGVWLFYVQHQFEDVYWERGDEWDYTSAAIEGSSFYKLPKVLQWFTGNIGYHHIHHLSPRIPNYNLERCHKSHEMFHQVKPLTLIGSFKTMRYRLFDEENRRLIGFREIRHLPRLHKAG
jgi:omega-6 fatty acid desaturase (delta-12 desaturase)